MPARTRRRQGRQFPTEVLMGGRAAPRGIVQRGMMDLERRLTRQFREQRALQVEANQNVRRAQEPLLAVLREDKRAAAGVRGLRALDSQLARHKLAPPAVRPEKHRIFADMGATVTPPYNYPWSWNQTSGGPALSVSADSNAGTMSFSIWNASKDASGSARAAVGIFFQPVVVNGILRLWSNPAINYEWWTYCVFASAHSDAFIGLYVGSYTFAGGFDGAPVDQMITLWSDDSWWAGAGDHTGTNSGYPLFAEFNVDSSHWYAMWVWCGGTASGDGWGSPFWGSGAGSDLSLTIPSMTWELF